MRVLPARRVGREEAAERLSVSLRRFLPIGPNGIPAVAEAFLIGVAVLGNDCGDAIRVPNGEAEANGCAIVEDVHSKRERPITSVKRSMTFAIFSNVEANGRRAGLSGGP